MKTHIQVLLAAVAAFGMAVSPPAQARKHAFARDLESFAQRAMEPGSTLVPANGQVEFAFSPREGAEALVIKAIRSSRRDIRIMAYSFTSAAITGALLEAKRRGVDIALVVDYRENVLADRSGKARAALSGLVNAGIPVRTIDVYQIAHDKVAVIDGATVQTGSFNYTQAAAKSNSENVIVMWNNPQLAKGYLAHWERNWRQGRAFQPAY